MANPVVHFEIVNEDHEALVDFYRDICSWRVNRAGGPRGKSGVRILRGSGLA